MSLIYHILDKIPAIYEDEMQDEYENLAISLAESGLMRIDTGYYCNFVRFTDSNLNINYALSIDEITNQDLVPKTKKLIKNLYAKKTRVVSEEKIKVIMTSLKEQIRSILNVSNELKLKLARLFVQSSHPIVIRWILLDKAHVFITYGNSIGDVMDIKSWQISGSNSGMQSISAQDICIYVACGGDPFAQNDEINPKTGNGWAALARFQIIAAQEIGHFADIVRNEHGHKITRHSADFACTSATDNVKKARIEDIQRCTTLLKSLNNNANLGKLLQFETELKFYDEQLISGIRVAFLKIKIKYYRHKLLQYAHLNKIRFIAKFSNEKYISITVQMIIRDMQANLSPSADVYKRENKQAEEAIACVEALARVPQQAIKWGHVATQTMMRSLYKIYYHQVIPSLIENYTICTGTNYRRNYHLKQISIWQKLLKFFKLGLYKNRLQLKEVRDI